MEWPWPKFAEWIAFYNIEPFGPMQEDLRSGYIASAIYNANPYRSPDAPALTPADFYPSLKPSPEVQAERDRIDQFWQGQFLKARLLAGKKTNGQADS